MHQAPLFFVFKHVLLANTHQPSFPFRVNSLGVKLASLALDAIMNARVSVEAQLQVTPPPPIRLCPNSGSASWKPFGSYR